jgi:CRP/FNR family transcriptional regulator
MTATLPFLKAVPLFKGLPAQDLAAVARIARREEAAKGQTLFTNASRGDTLYIVAKGAVKIFAKSGTGKTKTFAYLGPRDFFGEMALLGAGVRSAAAMALEASTLFTLRRADFEALLKRRPQLSLPLLRTLCDRLARANQEIASFTFNSVLGRTAQILINLSGQYGRKTSRGMLIDKEFSHKELADMAGTAREMVSRVLSRFVRAGCIAAEGRRIVLTDAKKLSDWILL